jgi:hypothetical protein
LAYTQYVSIYLSICKLLLVCNDQLIIRTTYNIMMQIRESLRVSKKQ